MVITISHYWKLFSPFLCPVSSFILPKKDLRGQWGSRAGLGAATNPFPNLSLVSVGQDVYVRLQGAGFDDHLVPGE